LAGWLAEQDGSTGWFCRIVSKMVNRMVGRTLVEQDGWQSRMIDRAGWLAEQDRSAKLCKYQNQITNKYSYLQ